MAAPRPEPDRCSRAAENLEVPGECNTSMGAMMAGRGHRRSRMSRAAGGTAAGMVLAVAAACSGHAPASHPSASSRSGGLQGESAGQVLQKVKAAAAGLHSVRISGRINGAGFDQFASSPCQNMSTVTFEGATVHFIRLGNALYYRADRAYYKKLGANARLPGRWRATTVAEAARAKIPGRSLLCMSDFLKLWSTMPSSGPSGAANHGIRTVQGEPAIMLLDSRTDAVYVAAACPAYVVALAFQGGNYINFSDFNQPVSINVPDSCPSRPAVPPGQVAVIC